MTPDQRQALREWAETRQRWLHHRPGADRDSRDLCDLDAALSAVLALADALGRAENAHRILAEANAVHRDREFRFAHLSVAFGMLETLSERYVEHLSTLSHDGSPGCIDRHRKARRVLEEAREQADRSLEDRKEGGT